MDQSMASDHYTPNGGRNSSGQGWQYSSNSNPHGRGTPPKKNNDGVSWAAIVMFFILGTFTGVFYVPAVILLVKKLTSMSKQDKERFRQEVNTTANTVRSEVRSSVTKTRTAGAGKGKQASAPSHSYDPEVNAKQKREKKPGLGRIIAGAIVAGIFAIPLPVVASEFLSSLFHGYFFADELSGLLVLLLFFCGGLGMLFSGVSSRRAQERYLGYLGYIGANREVNLAHMAAAFDVPVKKLCKDLRKMLAKGILPTGYLDLASGKLFLTEMGAKAPEPEKTAQTEANQDARTENDILWEIRQVNDQIPDEVMTAKIRRIEEITAKILAYQKTHPNRDSQLRSFLN